MKPNLLPFLCLCAASPLALAQAEHLTETQRLIDKWVETERIISAERSEAKADLEMLAATRDLLRQRVDALEDTIAELKHEAEALNDERVSLVQEQTRLEASSAALAHQLAGFEAQLKQRVETFPPPLQEKLAKLLVQIPDRPNASDVEVGKRLVTLLGVLSEAAKFNQSLTLTYEIRELEDGSGVQADTLYWGYAFAISADASGHATYFGRPSEAGAWQFERLQDHQRETLQIIEMAEGNTDEARFVSLPIPFPADSVR
ncbi:MAG: DUF3450 family protein [Verrucomicrobiota bacterium JB022]|nr:DUF3450 family protein [Verrucomicrobiota bacterium JB022]